MEVDYNGVVHVANAVLPVVVLDAIERDLANGRPFYFPNAQTKIARNM